MSAANEGVGALAPVSSLAAQVAQGRDRDRQEDRGINRTERSEGEFSTPCTGMTTVPYRENPPISVVSFFNQNSKDNPHI